MKTPEFISSLKVRECVGMLWPKDLSRGLDLLEKLVLAQPCRCDSHRCSGEQWECLGKAKSIVFPGFVTSAL